MDQPISGGLQTTLSSLNSLEADLGPATTMDNGTEKRIVQANHAVRNRAP